MLRACRLLLRRGGRVAFYTIHVAAGLDGRLARRAAKAGPVAVASRRSHEQLLRSAGFGEVDGLDVSAEFEKATRGWLELFAAHADEVRPLFPPGEFDERQAERRRQLDAIEAGILRRSLFVARA